MGESTRDNSGMARNLERVFTPGLMVVDSKASSTAITNMGKAFITLQMVRSTRGTGIKDICKVDLCTLMQKANKKRASGNMANASIGTIRMTS